MDTVRDSYCDGTLLYLAVILCQSFGKYYHWGNIGYGYMGSLNIVSFYTKKHVNL